jgi:hypothetical protein
MSIIYFGGEDRDVWAEPYEFPAEEYWFPLEVGDRGAAVFLDAIGAPPHYPEIGLDQFDDLIYGVDAEMLASVRFLSLRLIKGLAKSGAESAGRTFSFLDILSRHFERNGVQAFCEIR